jgi:hypothetical protein
VWYTGPNAISNAIEYAKFFSRSRDAVIRVYDDAGKVIETHEQAGDFKRAVSDPCLIFRVKQEAANAAISA